GQGRRPAVVVVLGILPEAEPSPPGSQMRTSSRSVSPPCSHRLDAQLLESPCTDRYARWCGRGGVARLPLSRSLTPSGLSLLRCIPTRWQKAPQPIPVLLKPRR